MIVNADREDFEAAISGPPCERDVRRFHDDPDRAAWPGNYRDIAVDLAWCMWQEAIKRERNPPECKP